MSYILDALKKSQAEKNSEGVTLAANTAGSKKPRPRGLLTLVILLVTTNICLLLWVTLQRSANNVSENVTSDSNPVNIPETQQSLPAATSNTQSPRVQTSVLPNTTSLLADTAPAQVAQPDVAETASPARVQTRRPAAPAVKTVQLSELPVSEQDKFNSFNYSSHIYTNDPELCAIVINGQQLSAGDLFEGMEVVAITEEGVVFGSSRLSTQGQREQLHVVISVIEQWEK